MVWFLYSMVENLVKKYPDSWHVHLPVSVLRFNCSVHPENKHRPLSLHRSEGTKPSVSPRDQPVCIVILQQLCSHWQPKNHCVMIMSRISSGISFCVDMDKCSKVSFQDSALFMYKIILFALPFCLGSEFFFFF